MQPIAVTLTGATAAPSIGRIAACYPGSRRRAGLLTQPKMEKAMPSDALPRRTEHLAEGVSVYLGDCRAIMSTLASVDAVVTDPPYGLCFRGEHWDAEIPKWLPLARAVAPCVLCSRRHRRYFGNIRSRIGLPIGIGSSNTWTIRFARDAALSLIASPQSLPHRPRLRRF
jgi:hypothetical protein